MNRPEHPLLLLEDDGALAHLITDELEANGWQVQKCDRLSSALQWLDNHSAEVIITDLRLPDGNGMDLVKAVVEQADSEAGTQRPGIIVITAFGTVPQAVEALKAGADEFLTKPLDLDHFQFSVQRVTEHRRLRQELHRYRQLSHNSGFHGILGQSPAMRVLYEQIAVIGRAQGPVLISGESGTGKELVARALCAESDRANQPFLAVNCAGIPTELLESEFFGHAPGAFTGARKSRKGLLQEADGGTLLLDEIAEMPLPLQAKLLRALQDGSIRPVGQDTEEKVDVRIIAATHQNLLDKVQRGEFREDLYYRLETFSLTVPALRERGEDRELLAQRFLDQYGITQNKPIKGFTRATMALLNHYHYPGNVRELQNIIERAVAFCNGTWIQPEHLPERLTQPKPAESGLVSDNLTELDERSRQLLAGPILPTLDELQQRYVRLIMKEVGGNKRRAAATLGIGRRTLYRWLDADTSA